ncbi:5-(carboxyamino)imidazole ribonucleotide synthase [Luminiphilus sp.]|nr:5-(carboxyamino)imidazole ribonucleotide synthase [Luminiphilus sp.]
MESAPDRQRAPRRHLMRIAIAGCGQLARMLALAGWEMGHHFVFIADPGESTDCVRGLGDVVHLDDALSGANLYTALGQPDIVTVEKEHVSIPMLESLCDYCLVAPTPEAIRICQHRGREKNLLQSLGVATAPFRLVDSAETLIDAVESLGYPAFVKSCEQGYDGQNQWLIKDSQSLETLAASMDTLPDLVVEGRIDFDRELSLIAVRSTCGDIATYPLSENRHREGILLTSEVPAPNVSQATSAQADAIAHTLLTHWSYVGVLSIELFDEGGVLRVNELAPRVHNSGHWSQDAGVTSQFGNHLRALTGVVPGATQPARYNGMLNLLGRSPSPAMLQAPDISLHWYTKSIRQRRKVGHLNLQASDRAILQKRLTELESELYPEGEAL